MRPIFQMIVLVLALASCRNQEPIDNSQPRQAAVAPADDPGPAIASEWLLALDGEGLRIFNGSTGASRLLALGSATPGSSTLATASGVKIGSTRAELESAYKAEIMESSLGAEFLAGGLAGLLDSPHPDAKISNLWAGETCIAR